MFHLWPEPAGYFREAKKNRQRIVFFFRVKWKFRNLKIRYFKLSLRKLRTWSDIPAF